MKKKANKPKKAAFIQDWGTYSNDTLVAVGYSHKELCFKMKAMRLDKATVLAFAAEKSLGEKWLTKANWGACWFHDGKTVLWFPEWQNDWRHWDTLLHECYHLVYGVLHRDKNMANDDEACAYQLEFLFREIRRKLYKRFDPEAWKRRK